MTPRLPETPATPVLLGPPADQTTQSPFIADLLRQNWLNQARMAALASLLRFQPPTPAPRVSLPLAPMAPPLSLR